MRFLRQGFLFFTPPGNFRNALISPNKNARKKEKEEEEEEKEEEEEEEEEGDSSGHLKNHPWRLQHREAWSISNS